MTPARVISALMMEREVASAHGIDLRICPDLWNPICASAGKGRVGREMKGSDKDGSRVREGALEV